MILCVYFCMWPKVPLGSPKTLSIDSRWRDFISSTLDVTPLIPSHLLPCLITAVGSS